ncbi:hypothetical protein [Alloactinosynnema sp. L-07]|uniref:hypothetical protein n=1 Tax=Alloactinosynnema sp. L-07 TaxID=1653480 RepID=UPI00065EEFF7|nr:hypothetical protein [Alloactinosynnema sp. L-07]CRK55531.1 hypothetical protein [Alloactinosynnema sp. L-07]
MTASTGEAKDLPKVEGEYLLEATDGNRIGIALSGGGIRSAAFNLGALQALQAHHVLENSSYLAAVSGGNYIASALTISAKYSVPVAEGDKPLWASGSPEERYLRQNTDYLASGASGKLWMAASIVFGFLLNYLPFMLCILIAGRVTGWLLYAAGVDLSDLRLNGLQWPDSPAVQWPLGAALGCVAAALLCVALRRFRDKPREFAKRRAEQRTAGFLVATGVIVVIMALPALAELYRAAALLVLTKVFGSDPGIFDEFFGRAVAIAFWLTVSLVMASAALVLGRRFRALRLMLTLSYVASAGLLLVPLLSALEHASRHGVDSPWDVIWVAVFALVVSVMAVAVHNRLYSMHNHYRERLCIPFAVQRQVEGEPGRRKLVVRPIDYKTSVYFSATPPNKDRHLPELVVCCAVNLTGRETPTGRYAASFTFERERSGGPALGERPSTKDIENHGGVAGSNLTLPSLMAMSGAALSPLMGRHTYPPVRFLMALTNIRLGVWIKNFNHARWSDPPKPPTTAVGKAFTWIRDGWHEPGALYVLREAMGITKSNHRYIYLTDGGHWENLGLVELLRRRCTHVLCFDASCDIKGAGLDIGRAIALARSDLDAEVRLDPTAVLPDCDGVSTSMVAAGNVTYPDRRTAKLVYAKAVMTKGASWDLHAFKARDTRFPNHATTQQTFTDEQFEAYRALGHAAGCAAANTLNLTLPGTASGNGSRGDNGASAWKCATCARA